MKTSLDKSSTLGEISMSYFQKKFVVLVVTAASGVFTLSSSALADTGVIQTKRPNVIFNRVLTRHNKWINTVTYYYRGHWHRETAKAYGAGLIVRHRTVSVMLTGQEQFLYGNAYYEDTKEVGVYRDEPMWQWSVVYPYEKLEGYHGIFVRAGLRGVYVAVYNPDLSLPPRNDK